MKSAPEPRGLIKHYATVTACQAAVAHDRWLNGFGAHVPRLHAIGPNRLDFEHICGRHARPHDVPQLAGVLGGVHRNAYASDLHRARLDRPPPLRPESPVSDFLTHRRNALTKLLGEDHASQSICD